MSTKSGEVYAGQAFQVAGQQEDRDCPILIAEMRGLHDRALVQGKHGSPLAVTAAVGHAYMLDAGLHIERSAVRAIRAIRPNLRLEPLPGGFIIGETPCDQLREAGAFTVRFAGCLVPILSGKIDGWETTMFKTPHERVKDQGRDETELVRGVGELFALAEGYPGLKVDQNFRQLPEELVNTEDRFQAARRFFKGNVRDTNKRIEMFPSSIVAGMGNFPLGDFFEVESLEVRAVPEVELQSLDALGSRASRRPSPRKLREKRVIAKKIEG